MKRRLALPVSLGLFASIALFPACHSSEGGLFRSSPRHVDDALLQHVSDRGRADVADARAREDEARDACAAAASRTKSAQDRRRLAAQDLEIAQAEAEKAEVALDIAEGGADDERERCQAAVRDTHGLVGAARARIAVRERWITLRRAEEGLADANLALAEAKVEAVKAHAVHEVDPPPARPIDVGTFEREVRRRQETVAVAQVRVDAARKEVEIAREAYEKAKEPVPAAYREDWSDEEKL